MFEFVMGLVRGFLYGLSLVIGLQFVAAYVYLVRIRKKGLLPSKIRPRKVHKSKKESDAILALDAVTFRESALWLSALMARLFCDFGDKPFLKNYVQQDLEKSFADMRRELAGLFVDNGWVNNVRFGTGAPFFSNIAVLGKGTDLSKLMLAFDLSYEGEIFLSLSLQLMFGLKLDVEVKIRKLGCRVLLEFNHKPLSTMSQSLLRIPEVLEADVKLMLGRTELPFLYPYAIWVVNQYLHFKMVLPVMKTKWLLKKPKQPPYPWDVDNEEELFQWTPKNAAESLMRFIGPAGVTMIDKLRCAPEVLKCYKTLVATTPLQYHSQTQSEQQPTSEQVSISNSQVSSITARNIEAESELVISKVRDTVTDIQDAKVDDITPPQSFILPNTTTSTTLASNKSSIPVPVTGDKKGSKVKEVSPKRKKKEKKKRDHFRYENGHTWKQYGVLVGNCSLCRKWILPSSEHKTWKCIFCRYVVHERCLSRCNRCPDRSASAKMDSFTGSNMKGKSLKDRVAEDDGSATAPPKGFLGMLRKGSKGLFDSVVTSFKGKEKPHGPIKEESQEENDNTAGKASSPSRSRRTTSLSSRGSSASKYNSPENTSPCSSESASEAGDDPAEEAMRAIVSEPALIEASGFTMHLMNESDGIFKSAASFVSAPPNLLATEMEGLSAKSPLSSHDTTGSHDSGISNATTDTSHSNPPAADQGAAESVNSMNSSGSSDVIAKPLEIKGRKRTLSTGSKDRVKPQHYLVKKKVISSSSVDEGVTSSEKSRMESSSATASPKDGRVRKRSNSFLGKIFNPNSAKIVREESLVIGEASKPNVVTTEPTVPGKASMTQERSLVAPLALSQPIPPSTTKNP